MTFKLYDKRKNQQLSEREFVDMILKSYNAGHTLLKIKLKNSPVPIDNLDQKINFLRTSQLNKFKKIVVQEYNKYRSNLQVKLIRIGIFNALKCGSKKVQLKESNCLIILIKVQWKCMCLSIF